MGSNTEKNPRKQLKKRPVMHWRDFLWNYAPGMMCGMIFAIFLVRSTFHPTVGKTTAESEESTYRVRKQLAPLPIAPRSPQPHIPMNITDNSTRTQILKAGKYTHKFSLTGYVFNENGKAVEITSTATSSILKDLSPRIEEEARKSFIDPGSDQLFFVLAPAIKFFQGKIHLTCRIWLNKERYVADFFVKNNMKRTLNDIQDNWLYTETLDTSLEPLGFGQVLGIPMDKKLEMSDGTLEPRMFSIRDRLFVTFNANIMYPEIGRLDTTFMYDLIKHDVFVPNVTGNTPSALQDSEWFPTDKAWMALIYEDELYFVHNLDPLWVMKCDLEAKCVWIHKQAPKNRFLYQSEPYVGSLRGGSPFEHYAGDYYISVAHNTLRKGSSYKRFYTTHVVMIHVNPWRIVYISKDLQFNKKIFESVPMQPTKEDDMDESFLFPVSMIVESQDSIVLGAHINDMVSVLLRVSGLERILNRAMKADQRLAPKDGPPIGYLQKHLRDMHLTENPNMWFV